MKDPQLLYNVGHNEAIGFLNPQATLLYLRNTNTGCAIFSIEDLGKIIAAHQARARIARRDSE